MDKVYYWRIDEFDGVATHKGDVFSFRTMPEIPITDPDLICWWKLDEGSGTNVLDWSGHGNHGTLIDTRSKIVHGAKYSVNKIEQSERDIVFPAGYPLFQRTCHIRTKLRIETYIDRDWAVHVESQYECYT